MCGIAGKLCLANEDHVREAELRQMLAMLRHRGPDEFGIYLDGQVGLGNARLSIIDLGGGQQPISNEDGTLWIVFNGEIFNYVELRPELEAKGHRFATNSDTEVLLHLYEEYGAQCLERLNGQFAFAIWNARDRSLFMARDRLGVRPLFYTVTGGQLFFASEIKAILVNPQVRGELDPVTLNQIFTFWCPLSPRTIFKYISELPPGHYLRASGGKVVIKPYWELDFNDLETGLTGINQKRPMDEYLEEFRSLLVDSVKIRLRADVPVGAYLSGGLDSSTIASIIRNDTSNRLDTFSIAFNDRKFDESLFQRQMARFLGTEHQVVCATHADIGRVFPEVIWHAEIPLMRTSPAPMFLLSKLVRDSGYKVVLTGEGADEFLAGYDIFKEAKIRRFWAKQPASKRCPLLLQRLYPDIGELGKVNPSFLEEFFRGGLTEVGLPSYSHSVRWRNNRRACRFFSKDLAAVLSQSGSGIDQVSYPTRFDRWGAMEQAQFLEISIFLSQYLLSSQGDRMGMAHSIEGRFPFLDCRLVEFCNRLPANLKMRGLTEKYLLKKLGKKWLPQEIWSRPKRPYRAPIHRSFFNEITPDYVRDVLSPNEIRQTGLFNPVAVSKLVSKIDQGAPLGESDDMALVGIISTQLVHRQFVTDFTKPPPLNGQDKVKVCKSLSASTGERAG
jgi:asparagine synthase (glutamine-hydrolysing)